MTFQPTASPDIVRANLAELQNQTDGQVKITDVKITNCKLEGDNLIVGAYGSDNLSVERAENGESGHTNSSTGTGRRTAGTSEEDNLTVHEKFFADLNSDTN